MTAHIRIAPIAEAQSGPTAYQLLIDGKWVNSQSGQTIDRISPAHGVAVSTYQRGNREDALAAVAAARKAFDHGSWPRMTGAARAKLLLEVAAKIEMRLEEFARLDALEAGKPIAQVRGEMAGAVDIWRFAASLARTLHGQSFSTIGEKKLGIVVRDAIGVVSIITPWNFPFLILSQKLPFALAAGCTTVVKPSEMTSASALLLGELLIEAGLPAGVVNIVTGPGSVVGAPTVESEDVDMVSFTGSTKVGKSLMASAAQTLKKVSMELGGKNAQIVFPDADLDAATDAIVFGAFFNAGECCNAGSRLIVHASIADDLVERVRTRTGRVRVGDPLDEATIVGALISDDHAGKIGAFLEGAKQAGASFAVGGDAMQADSGRFIAPTIVTGVTPDMAVAKEEIFGPVLSVLTFETAEEAIAIANGTEYGLSASVWSRDFDTCHMVGRAMQAGTVWINTFMDGASELPFGGFKQSGLGRELGIHAVEDYTEEKTLHLHSGGRANPWVVDAI
jgi:acyl-CoA reductase-like NAD-dependent aldehyde dehydrogenase